MFDDPLAPLRDHGQRTWRRFAPDEPLVADVTLQGRRVGQRRVVDLSLGGLKLQVRARDVRHLPIGEHARVRLDLGGTSPITVVGRVVHVQQVGGGWFGTWSVGLMFPLSHSLDEARPELSRYLLVLAQSAGKRAA
jgi:hypothetical protein